ncbi:response regulator [Imhoffiella purpurea]|uniref:histidine kinase n=1 Tax=Imhoffiella purpurea TaxID=1249627 RepID=W9VBK6_9GAMM|nr:response regulator [Imhoffiella purpurea]EXJ13422.1 putative hybrid sensor and regulator protein [Imhoffiella purpurea]
MSASADIEILYELSLAIGEGTEPEPMLRRFLVEMQRLLGGVGAAVLHVQQQEQRNEDTPQGITAVPDTLTRTACYATFWDQWSARDLYESLSRNPDELPLIWQHEECTLHAFRLPGFGILLFLAGHEASPMSQRMQHAFVPLVRRLANAANACIHRAQMRHQTQRFELARESAGIGVWEWDLCSGQLVWDFQMRQLCGVANDAFGGTFSDWRTRIHPDDIEPTLRTLDRLAKEADYGEIEFRILRPDSDVRHLRKQATLVRSPTGEVLRMVGVCTDITADRQAESDLERARDLAERANRGRSQFISAMGNRIHDPMQTILKMAELALDTELTSTQRGYLDRLKASGETLLALLDDLLDVAHIDTGELQIQSIPFNLAIMVAETLEPLAIRAENKGLTFVADLPEDQPQFHVGDPGRIRQVLTSLCATAIDLSMHGEIRIQLASRPNRVAAEDDIQIAVIANGIDIQCSDLRQLLAVLAPTRTAHTPLHPIDAEFGLTMAARLIEHLGGHLRLDAKPEGVKIFYVNLSLPRTEPPEIPLGIRQSWQGRRALIVDDNALNRRTLAYWLDDWGFSTRESGNGRSALQLARTAEPSYDVILLDSILPGMDAYDLTRQLSEEGLIGQAKIILISASATRGEAQRCREAGIDAFLTKPTPPCQIRDLLTRLLESGESKTRPTLLTRHDLKEQRSRLRILLVESKELDRKLAQSLLAQWGHSVTSVGDEAIAIERFAPMTFDLVMIDLEMHDANGIDTIRRLREKEDGMDFTPIIGMSADTLANDPIRFLEAGMDDIIAKPIQADALEERVLRLIEDRKKRNGSGRSDHDGAH